MWNGVWGKFGRPSLVGDGSGRYGVDIDGFAYILSVLPIY